MFLDKTWLPGTPVRGKRPEHTSPRDIVCEHEKMYMYVYQGTCVGTQTKKKLLMF